MAISVLTTPTLLSPAEITPWTSASLPSLEYLKWIQTQHVWNCNLYFPPRPFWNSSSSPGNSNCFLQLSTAKIMTFSLLWHSLTTISKPSAHASTSSFKTYPKPTFTATLWLRPPLSLHEFFSSILTAGLPTPTLRHPPQSVLSLPLSSWRDPCRT